MTATKTTAEILREAAGLVRRGWMQGGVGRSGRRVCAYGGVAEAVSEGRFPDDATRDDSARLLAELRDAQATAAFLSYALRLPSAPAGWYCGAPDANRRVYAWNDNKNQTAENVAAGLEYAALVWEQEQAAVTSAGEQPVGDVQAPVSVACGRE